MAQMAERRLKAYVCLARDARIQNERRCVLTLCVYLNRRIFFFFKRNNKKLRIVRAARAARAQRDRKMLEYGETFQGKKVQDRKREKKMATNKRNGTKVLVRVRLGRLSVNRLTGSTERRGSPKSHLGSANIHFYTFRNHNGSRCMSPAAGRVDAAPFVTGKDLQKKTKEGGILSRFKRVGLRPLKARAPELKKSNIPPEVIP